MVPVFILTCHQVGMNQTGPPGKQGIYVSSGQFELQMRLLAMLGYRSIGLGDLLESLAQEAPRRKKVVVITFDDGYEGVASAALPVLQRYGFKATAFLIAEDYAGQVAVTERAFQTLNKLQVKSLLEHGWDIGSHTMTLPDLREEKGITLEQEIAGSKRALEERFGRPVRWFAYPYGSASPAIAKLVQEAGYLGAVTTEFGRTHRAENRYGLKRIAVGSAQRIPQFYYRLRWGRR